MGNKSIVINFPRMATNNIDQIDVEGNYTSLSGAMGNLRNQLICHINVKTSKELAQLPNDYLIQVMATLGDWETIVSETLLKPEDFKNLISPAHPGINWQSDFTTISGNLYLKYWDDIISSIEYASDNSGGVEIDLNFPLNSQISSNTPSDDISLRISKSI